VRTRVRRHRVQEIALHAGGLRYAGGGVDRFDDSSDLCDAGGICPVVQ
jgi:hypothetical protein